MTPWCSDLLLFQGCCRCCCCCWSGSSWSRLFGIRPRNDDPRNQVGCPSSSSLSSSKVCAPEVVSNRKSLLHTVCIRRKIVWRDFWNSVKWRALWVFKNSLFEIVALWDRKKNRVVFFSAFRTFFVVTKTNLEKKNQEGIEERDLFLISGAHALFATTNKPKLLFEQQIETPFCTGRFFYFIKKLA